LNHRKITSYVALGDTSNSSSAYGTHIVGTLVRKANCFNSSAAVCHYQAPEAKILFYDILKGNSGDIDPDFNKIISQFEKFRVSISSNSWGYFEDNSIYSHSFDFLCYKYPFITFIFAAGNSRKPMIISIPSSSKNVISVSAISKASLQNWKMVFMIYSSFKQLVKFFMCKVPSSSESILRQMTGKPNYSFRDLTTQESLVCAHSLPQTLLYINYSFLQKILNT
jgi:hypothetical protein